MTRQSLISRRRMLTAVGAGATVALAGCSGSDSNGEGESSPGQETESSENDPAATQTDTSESDRQNTPSIEIQGSWPSTGGTQRWTNHVEASTHPSPPFTELWTRNVNTASPALLDGERIYIERDEQTRALDVTTGERVWRQSGFAPTAIAGDYLVSTNGRFGILDAESGERIRGPIGSGKYDGFYLYAWSPDWVYGMDQSGGKASVVRLHDLVSGDQIWERGPPADTGYEDIRAKRGFASSTNTVFATAFTSADDDRESTLLGIDANRGDIKWTVTKSNYFTIFGVLQDAVVVDTDPSTDDVRTFTGINHETGEKVWETQVNWPLGGDFIVKDTVLRVNSESLTANRLQTGGQLWQKPLQLRSSGIKAFGRGNRLYISGIRPSSGKFVTEVYNIDGTQEWTLEGIAAHRATNQTLIGPVGSLDNYSRLGMFIEE